MTAAPLVAEGEEQREQEAQQQQQASYSLRARRTLKHAAGLAHHDEAEELDTVLLEAVVAAGLQQPRVLSKEDRSRFRGRLAEYNSVR
jgi:hypothetical protein